MSSQESSARRRNINHKTDRRRVERSTCGTGARAQGAAGGSFEPRESPLTELFESPHIRSIYNIFVVILVMLFLNTVIYDFVESGTINVGWATVVAGFGDTSRAAKIWLFEFAVALAVYPGLRVYAAGYGFLRNHTVVRKAWCAACLAGVVALQSLLVLLPVRELAREHLAIASGVAVICELFRFAMKIHAAVWALAPRVGRAPAPRLPTLQHYVYFLFAPTLLYRDQYLRSKATRWGVVAVHLLEVVGIIFYNSFLWERFILPYWSDYGKERQVEAGKVVRGLFACVLPGVLSYLCGFYCMLHAWLNAFAEMLTFADRLFYEDWWTTSRFSSFYRAWNRVVHVWLREHVHAPLAPRAGRPLAALTVFLLSAVAHELILALSFGYFYPILLVMFASSGFIFVPLTSNLGQRFPRAFNLIIWLSLFIGNGILWSLYPMEFFARKNCPASEGDSFFIPKSWSCPTIVLKPNWHFQNPL